MTEALLKALTAKEITEDLCSSLPIEEVLRCKLREVSDSQGMQTFRELMTVGEEKYPDAVAKHRNQIALAAIFSKPSSLTMAGLRQLVAEGKLPTAWHIEHCGPWMGEEKSVVDVPLRGPTRCRNLLTVCRVVVDAWEPLAAVDTSPAESPTLPV